jgi:TonB family protein
MCGIFGNTTPLRMKTIFFVLAFIPSVIYCQLKRDTIKREHGSFELKPVYPGGEEALNKLFRSYKYPVSAKRDKVEDSVIVQYVIDTLGCITNVNVLNNPRSDLQQEALRLVYSQKQWLPAIYNTRKVKAWKRRVIYFKL